MQTTHLSVLTWNINRRSISVLEPLKTLTITPDIVLLQEVACVHAAEFSKQLGAMGYDVAYSGQPDAPEKKYGNLIASRTKQVSVDVRNYGLPWAQLLAHSIITPTDSPVHLLNVHVPNGSGNGWKKIETLEALKQVVLFLKGAPLILAGDFNEPFYALQDNQCIVTYGLKQLHGQWSPWRVWSFGGVSDTGERWDAAVRWFFENQEESGIRHTLWESTGRGAMEPSHLVRGAKRWFDHTFVSDHFRVISCVYEHSFRLDGYSDHSAVITTLSRTPTA